MTDKDNGSDGNVRLALAQVQIELNTREQDRAALDQLDQVLRREPRNAFAWRLMAIAHGRLGDKGMTSLALAEGALARGRAGEAHEQAVRAERERARFRLHLVRHRTGLKNRIHATLITFGHPVPMADLFGVEGRKLLARLDVPEPWRSSLMTSLAMESRDGVSRWSTTWTNGSPLVPRSSGGSVPTTPPSRCS